MAANNALVKHNGNAQDARAVPAGPVAIPAVDISEIDEGYVLHLDMPGAEKDSISVTVADGTPAVKAPVAPMQLSGGTVLYREIRKGSYERRFTLGDGIDRNTVEARYDNGVLTVRLRKSDALKPKEINIR